MEQIFNFIYNYRKQFLIGLCILFILNVIYCALTAGVAGFAYGYFN